MIRSVSQTLYKPTDEVTLKLTVGLLDSRNENKFFNVWDTDSGEYLTFDTVSANLVLQYKPKNAEFDRDRNLYISVKNIFQWTAALTSFYNKMQNPEVFSYYKSGVVECKESKNYKHSITLSGNQFVELEPCVIYDTTGQGQIPGITFRINNTDNEFNLSIDEFESLYYIYKTINIPREAMQLLIARLVVDNKIKIQSSGKLPEVNEASKPIGDVKQNQQPRRGSLFDNKPNREGVIDKRQIESAVNGITSLDDIERIKNV